LFFVEKYVIIVLRIKNKLIKGINKILHRKNNRKGRIGMYLPEKIQKYIKDMELQNDHEGMSKAKVIKCTEQNKELYLKIEKVSSETEREYNVYQWLQGKLPVPKIICRVIENDTAYMLLEKAEGLMLEDDLYRSNPDLLIKLAADGINQLQKLDVSECKFDSTIDYKLKKAKERIDKGFYTEVDHNKYTEGINNTDEAYEYLVKNKPKEILVFSHGDYCLNNFFSDGNSITGYIDMGRGGIADRHQDVALCIRELLDFPSEYTDRFLKNLKFKPDMKLIRYYILLDELF